MTRPPLSESPVALALLGPFVAVGLWYAWLWVALSGGIDDVFRIDPPRAGDREVVAAAERVAGPFRDAVRDDAARVVVPALGDEAALLGRGEPPPSCLEGHHNWIEDDPYDLVCELSAVEVVGVAGRDGFRARMHQLDDALTDDGWYTDPYLDMDRVLTDYWDQMAYSTGTGGEDGYSMEDLPSTDYVRQVDGHPHTLSVRWVEQHSPDRALALGLADARLRTAAGESVTPPAMVRLIPAEGYAVVLTYTVEYFKE